MSIVEISTFRLVDSGDVSAFLQADRRVQTELIPNQPGFLRRTTARGDDGEWLVVVLWFSESDAEDFHQRSQKDPAQLLFMEHVNESTVSVKRYATLD